MTDFFDNPLFQNAPVAYSILDADGAHVAGNRRFWALFGRGDGRDISAVGITHPDDQDGTSDYLDDLRAGRRDEVRVEKRYVRGDDSVFWGRLTATRLQDADDQYILGMIDDIDDEVRLRTDLEEALDQNTEFVARVSHELRGPMHTIAGLAELLAASDIGARERRQAETIAREANAAASIVSDLLDIGRSDTGNLTIESTDFAIRGVVDRVIRNAAGVASAKGLGLTAEVDDRVRVHATGDPGRLGQILDNLVRNAIKFTTEGSVALAVTAHDRDVVGFRVSDTGPGVPADRAAEIFEPFGRLNASAPGAGLGLAISSRLATVMGGSLELVPTAATSPGATFELLLPLPEGAPVAVAASPGAAHNDPSQHRILVVEDSHESQMLAGAQLDRLGYPHDMVADGPSALDIERNVSYAVILMDWHLPGIDGLEVIRRIRAREAEQGLARTPIVSVTARAMAADVQACFDAGADDFLAKPASLTDLGSMLERWTKGGDVPDDEAVIVETEQPLLATLLEDLGDETVVISLAETFLGELPDRTAAVSAGVDNADPTAVAEAQRAAHTIKSTAAIVGATELSELARTIEDHTRSGAAVTPELDQRLRCAAEQARTDVENAVARLRGVPNP